VFSRENGKDLCAEGRVFLQKTPCFLLLTTSVKYISILSAMNSDLRSHPHTYRDQLRRELERRQASNPRYSLRSFARDLDLTPGFLSSILSGRKVLSAEKAFSVAKRLGYNDNQTLELVRLIQRSRDQASLRSRSSNKTDQAGATEFSTLHLDAFQVIADWYHYAILEMTFLDQFDGKPSTIAKRLGIPAPEAREALGRLLRLGLIEKCPTGRYVKTQAFIATPSDQPNPAIKLHHAQLIEKARLALIEQDISERDITGVTLSFDPKHLPWVKAELRKFRRKLTQRIPEGARSEIYQLNLQFFRLSKKEALK